MKNLIERIIFHILNIMRKQYKIMLRIVIDENKFASCIKIFEITINISCAHTIQIILKQNENSNKLQLNDIHFH